MTAPKLLVFAVFTLLAFDYTYNNNRLVEMMSDQATHFGYWLSNELLQIERRIAPLR